MFVNVLIVYPLFHKRLDFLQNFCYEILRTGTVGSNIANYRNSVYLKFHNQQTKSNDMLNLSGFIYMFTKFLKSAALQNL